ncbi:TetR/AcrR family transcriptional regulator [Vagococcus acidifermentans]|uniref:HTH tetR-type domain-containing protein n=1 Tax=Vagococcus acidifermentans TaxID=564710 RepID=A0A430AVH6_9ENTE|nr:TetR/AcrR family transcriptional regulator [Vagococcus acidifermentans]RSU12053.1 hypothetical protein CBF27_06400 [Vagococcus acidifermentans]
MSQLTKKQEQSLITRQKLVDAAFENFFDVGFENTTLEKISRDAHVSRGAAYWHFKNKHDLFRETVLSALERIKKRKQPIYEDDQQTFKEKAVQMIAIPYNDNQDYKFLQQASQTIEKNPEFEDLKAAIEATKLKLYHFFLNGIRDLQKAQSGTVNGNAAEVATLLFTYFEGMHSTLIPPEVSNCYTPEAIEKSLELIFQHL